MIAHAAASPSHPALALLTSDPEGDPTLILCHPSISPPELYATAVRPPLPHGTAAAFAAASPQRVRVHRRLADGEPVVVELSDVPAPRSGSTLTRSVTLLPWGVAWHLHPEDLHVLLDSAAILLAEGANLQI